MGFSSLALSASLWCGRILLLLLQSSELVSAKCIENEEIDNVFVSSYGRIISIPRFDSCCMYDVCGLQCPTETSGPSKGYGIAAIVAITLSFLVGAYTYFFVQGSVENFFVAGRSLPFFVTAITLAAQSIDSNALLGNADLSYKYAFWDGAVLPIGLGLSLIINGLFLAGKVNSEKVLTLPDIFAKRYGRLVEVLVSVTTCISFMMLLAGNLVGMGVILAYMWNMSESGAIWISSAVVWSYTVCGGLFSVAYTDVLQGTVGWLGCLVAAYHLISNQPPAPGPSIGFPGYVYPDGVGDGGICDMYQGIPCIEGDPSVCCYNEELWCPSGPPHCDRYDRGAYPTGDQRIFGGQMTDHLALSPFPNAIFWNWATIVILALGNVAALDFQARCMASKTPRGASLACLFGGCVTFFVGIPFAYLGGIMRVHYGPDSTNSVFETDSCSVALGLPTCAAWIPDSTAFVKTLTNHVPPVIGAWCLIGIVSATMSTADGAILAVGTVMSNNIFRQIGVIRPDYINSDNLILVARISTLPFTLAATSIAAYYRSLDGKNAAGSTGYLLIVAFDIVLATTVVPLFGAFYTKNPSPRAALISILGGAITRITLEFVLKKDGSLLLPYPDDEFLNYGPAASALPPAFINSTEVWDPSKEQCLQESFEDFTGVDSLSALLVSFILFVSVQTLEYMIGGPLFHFRGGTGYEKSHDTEKEMVTGWTKTVEVLFAVIGFLFLVFTVFSILLTRTL